MSPVTRNHYDFVFMLILILSATIMVLAPLYCLPNRSTSPPGGNQVDGLPPALSNFNLCDS